MNCPKQGLLKAYADEELPAAQHQVMSQHLADCPGCQLALESLRQDADLVRNLLDEALITDSGPNLDPYWALARCQNRLLTKPTIWNRITQGGRRMFSFQHTAGRLAMAAVAFVLCLTVLLAFEPVRLAAEDLLGVFRVERFTAVTVDPDSLTDVPNPSDLGTFTRSNDPKTQQVSREEAQSMVGFTIADLPESLGLAANTPYAVTEGFEVSYTFDGEQVKAYLAARGISPSLVPANIDGATIRVSVAPFVTRQGHFPDGAARGNQRYISLSQTTSPTLEVPPDLDVEMIRSQLLSSGLLPNDLAGQLAAINDWQNTAIIPVPENATRVDVDVAGAPGLLISVPDQATIVCWQRNGVVYALGGTRLTDKELLDIARSIK